MRARGTSLGTIGCLAIFMMTMPSGVTESVAELQARFDRESNAVRKAKLLEKLGNAQFEAARTAGKAGDNNSLGATLEKYRDNARAAFEALKKQSPNFEKHWNGYRQLEMHVERGIREVEDSILAAPEVYKPPLEIVRQDLIAMDKELLERLFPRRPADQHATSPPAEKKP